MSSIFPRRGRYLGKLGCHSPCLLVPLLSHVAGVLPPLRPFGIAQSQRTTLRRAEGSRTPDQGLQSQTWQPSSIFWEKTTSGSVAGRLAFNHFSAGKRVRCQGKSSKSVSSNCHALHPEGEELSRTELTKGNGTHGEAFHVEASGERASQEDHRLRQKFSPELNPPREQFSADFFKRRLATGQKRIGERSKPPQTN